MRITFVPQQIGLRLLLLIPITMNEELTHEERKRWAYFLFTTHDLSIGDIALETSTDETTVRAWAHEDRWGQIKRSRLTSKAAQIEYLYAVLENLRSKSSREANPKDADLMLKYTTAIHKLENATTLTEIIDVSELFVRWLRRKDLALTKILVKHFDAFIKEHIPA